METHVPCPLLLHLAKSADELLTDPNQQYFWMIGRGIKAAAFLQKISACRYYRDGECNVPDEATRKDADRLIEQTAEVIANQLAGELTNLGQRVQDDVYEGIASFSAV